MFTTYHSLGRVVDAGVDIDVAYFDEAHNSVAKSFFVNTWATSQLAQRCYFFTATPRVSRRHNRGMNNAEVYGPIIENVPAPELINNGSIIPPQIVPFVTGAERVKTNAHTVDANTVQDIIDNLDKSDAAKVLVAVPSSRLLGRMLGETDLLQQLRDRGYHVLHVTSKFLSLIHI